jgi:6-pyruvoyltetrahydropterin/6-carboxytetrahydropterin synthase
MKTTYIIRKEHFNSAHKLFREDWSEDKNEEIFGRCSNKNWHGHNFNLFVTVKGIPSVDTGFIINLKVLSKIIKENVINKLDHKNLNLDVPELIGVLPSIENLVIFIWDWLDQEIAEHGGKLCKLRLEETENNFVEYFGGTEPY